jgi:hypothetical protein
MKVAALLLANTLARASIVANTLARASLPALAALGASLSGCATIIKGEMQTISVATPPVEGARCVFYGADGYYRDVITPGRIDLRRDREDLAVTCMKRGFKDASATLSSDFNFVTLGNAIIGGMTGVIVDATSGANDSYPHEIEIPMEPLPKPAAAEPATTTRYTLSNPAS